MEQFRKAQPDAQWVQLGPLSGPAGDGAIPRNVNAPPAMFAIPRALEDDQNTLSAIMKLINYVSTEEGNRLVAYGVEGEHYKLVAGEVEPTEKLDAEGGYFWLYQFTGRDEAEYLATKFADDKELIDFAENQPALPIYNSLVVPPEGYNAGDADRFASEQLARFIGGDRPLTEYQDFLDTLSGQFRYEEYVESARQQLQDAGVRP